MFFSQILLYLLKDRYKEIISIRKKWNISYILVKELENKVFDQKKQKMKANLSK